MTFSGQCEEFGGESKTTNSNGIPNSEFLLYGSLLRDFVTNPNLKLDGDGNYVVNYSDPDYIEGDPLTIPREERVDPSVDDVIVQVNFSQETTTLIVGDLSLDVSHRYFLEME